MGGSTFIELMKQDDTGIYRYAEQKGENAPPSLVTPMECHLKFPIAEGNSWNMATKLGNSTVNVSLTIESVSDEVKVPAGTFKDCVKIKQVGENDAGTSVMGLRMVCPQGRAWSRAWSPSSKNPKRGPNLKPGPTSWCPLSPEGLGRLRKSDFKRFS